MFVPRTAKCNVTLTQTHLQHGKSTRLTTVGQQTHNLNVYKQKEKQDQRILFVSSSQQSRIKAQYCVLLAFKSPMM